MSVTLEQVDAELDARLVKALILNCLRVWPNELLEHEDGECEACDARAGLQRTALRRYREEFAAGRADEAFAIIKFAAYELLET